MLKRFKFMKESLLSSLFCIGIFMLQAQELTWRNPLTERVIQGRSKEVLESDGFARLPLALKESVREPVWNLGNQSAGVYIDFKTAAEEITVRYQVKGALNMPHMPSTGVSGLDLYAKDTQDNAWKWAHGGYSFKDTITYTFKNLGSHPNVQYRLYLPMYNKVEWMEIGTSSAQPISFLKSEGKPIVVYGTSIAQGACATRPGLGWTNILGRNFGQEVINLAFSGNGRLEQPILDLINKVDASVYILDCIPNLGLTKDRDEAKLKALIEHAVEFLRKDHPTTPIIMADHSSSEVPGILNEKPNDNFKESSRIGRETIAGLKKKGVKNLYWLSSKDIGLDIDNTVDYAHPNDMGMEKIAKAYRELLKKVLR